jgi:predicted small secreted protein
MKIRSMMLLLVCAVALSGCETINGAWHDVFGLNGAPSRTASN